MIFVVGTGRSGTTVFRELISSNGYYDMDEIFQGNLNHPCRFYNFLYTKISEDKKFVFSIYHQDVFYEYVEKYENEYKGKCIADVKLNCFRLLDSTYSIDAQIPFFIKFLTVVQFPVVRIRRLNKLRLIVSYLIAEKTNIWSTIDKKPYIYNTKVNPNTIHEEITKLIDLDSKCEKLLESVPNVYRIDYETMFDERGLFTPFAISIAEECTNSKGFNRVPIIKKQNPDQLESLVENFSEIECVLKDTEHSWMLYE